MASDRCHSDPAERAKNLALKPIRNLRGSSSPSAARNDNLTGFLSELLAGPGKGVDWQD